MPLPNLITSRTSSDVERVRELSAKGASMTAAELLEFLSGMKGSYNASDLNRVGEAVEWVADRLNGYGYAVTVAVKTDWQRSDIPTPEQMQTYLDGITTLRNALSLPISTPAIPADMDGLTYSEANDIERILEIVDGTIARMAASFVYCGQPHSGVIWTQIS